MYLEVEEVVFRHVKKAISFLYVGVDNIIGCFLLIFKLSSFHRYRSMKSQESDGRTNLLCIFKFIYYGHPTAYISNLHEHYTVCFLPE